VLGKRVAGVKRWWEWWRWR